MKPTHFRAYAADSSISRRAIPVKQEDGSIVAEKVNLAHDVHNPAVEGAVKDGVASFSSKSDVAYVAFYSGEGDDTVCVGVLDGPFTAGRISADFADIPEEPQPELAEGEVLLDGQTYRKVD